MTTFHESQPQSRRAARQSERQEGTDQPEFTGDQPDGPEVYSVDDQSGATWTDAANAAEQQDAPQSSAPRGRRAAAPAGPPTAVSETIETRAPQRTPVPSYDGPSFTNRAPRADPDADSTEATPQSDDLPPTQAIQQVDRPAYRVRDFSPEGRRSTPQAHSQWMPRPAGDAAASDDDATVASFRPPSESGKPTVSSRPQFFVPESALQDTIVPSVNPVDAVPYASPDPEPEPKDAAPEPAELPFVEHTMTRRELRALEARQAAELASAAKPVPTLPEFAADGSLTGAAAAVFVETDFDDDKDDDKEDDAKADDDATDDSAADDNAADDNAVESDAADDTATDDSAVVEIDEPADALPTLVEPAIAVGSNEEAAADDAAAVDEVPFVAPALSPFDALFQVPPAAPTVAPAGLLPPPFVPPTGDAAADEIAPSEDDDSAQPAEPFFPPVDNSAKPIPSLSDAFAEFDSITREAVDSVISEAEPEDAPKPASETSWNPPVGHWSAQGEVDEDSPSEGNISRTIGSGILTTNALVLPSVPDGADIRGPLSGTGEIMITGSIDLPRTLSSTGQSDRFDGESMDALFDLGDAEVTSTDSSPVRAIRAVSTHTSGHGVTHTQKPKGTKALTGLLIAASSLAVVVAGLLVAAFAFNVF